MRIALGIAGLLAALTLTPFGGVWAGGFRAEPSEACDFLAHEGLRIRGGYQSSGDIFRCRSQRKNLIGGGRVNNNVRFVAQGDAQAVRQLTLELRVNSRTAVQRAHRQLVDLGSQLMQAALGTAMPQEIETAILAASSGSWRVDDNEVRVDRIVLGAPAYELRFRIQ